jgi:hypothetical protein
LRVEITVPGLRRVQGIGLLVRVSGVEQHQQEFAKFYAAVCDDCLHILLISVGDRRLAEDQVADAYTKARLAWRKGRQHPAPRGEDRADRAERARVLVPAAPLTGHDTTAAAAQHPALDNSLVAALRRLPPAASGHRPAAAA